MANKDETSKSSTPADDKAYQEAIEEKVRQMLDPEIKDAGEPAATAPELQTDASDDEVESGPTAEATDPTEAHDTTDEPDSSDADQVEEDEASSPQTDKAVDDIIAAASDELMAAKDEELAAAFDNKKPSFGQRLKAAWSNWWHNPLKRRATLTVLVLLLMTVFTVPASRYFLLNTAGVRSSASLTVLDASTQQPLKNVDVKLGSHTGRTDSEGQVKFQHVRLGNATLTLEKRAFAPLEKQVTIGWGSNPLDSMSIEPVGSQYTILVTDYLSSQPVAKAEASSGEADAQSDEAGKITLTLDVSDDTSSTEVTVSADGYREEKVTLNLDTTESVQLQLVPERAHVFVSKRSGKYDVYRIDADGRNESVILAGSGTERDDLVLVPHPSENFVALVSTRENVRNEDGFLLSTLTLIDLSDNTPSKIAQSERIQIVDWVGKRLVYVQIASGASASDPKRHRLMSYDLESGESKEIAAANYFNDVLAANGSVYYAPSNAYSTGPVEGFFKINADGSQKQTAYSEEVWNTFRTEYDKLVLSVAQDWYDYQISSNKVSQLSGEPANLQSRVYIDSPDRQHSLWVDTRDGKGVLLVYNLSTRDDDVVHEQSGLTNPVRWLNDNSVVFRVSTSQETADYVMSLNGGEPKKLRDVTNTAGVDRWYYY